MSMKDLAAMPMGPPKAINPSATRFALGSSAGASSQLDEHQAAVEAAMGPGLAAQPGKPLPEGAPLPGGGTAG